MGPKGTTNSVAPQLSRTPVSLGPCSTPTIKPLTDNDPQSGEDASFLRASQIQYSMPDPYPQTPTEMASRTIVLPQTASNDISAGMKSTAPTNVSASVCGRPGWIDEFISSTREELRPQLRPPAKQPSPAPVLPAKPAAVPVPASSFADRSGERLSWANVDSE